MNYPIGLRKGIYSGIGFTIILSILFVTLSWKNNSTSEIFIALPYFMALYFIFSTIDRHEAGIWVRNKIQNNIRYLILFPLLLIILFYSYLGINGSNPLKDSLLLVPYLLFFPILAFAARDNNRKEIDWFDFTIFFLFFFPVTLVNIKPSGNLPFNGSGFDSIYRIEVMLAALFAYSVIRKIKDIGAYPVFRWKFLITTIWVWLAFYLFVFIIGYSIQFITLKDNNAWNYDRIEKIIRQLVAVFLHTALFEELVFRGLLQNMLAKRIAQASSFKNSWWRGIIIMGIISLIIGFSMKGSMHWFPALVTLIIFVAAFLLEKAGKQSMGAYTSMAITSTIFGLVHFHTGSIVFVGLACIGGWAYGYVYMKTKNIFYAALLHALVNTTPLIFGLALAK